MIVLILACEDRTPDPKTIPDWMEPRVEELESSDCPGCKITRVTYMDEYFYQVYCNYWSCLYCEVYHYNGDSVDWTVTDQADFIASQSNPVILWTCPVE